MDILSVHMWMKVCAFELPEVVHNMFLQAVKFWVDDYGIFSIVLWSDQCYV